MMAHNSNLINIRNYLAHHKWDLPQANVSGVTWLEIMASFEILGYRLEQPVQQRADKNKAKPLLALKANIDLF